MCPCAINDREGSVTKEKLARLQVTLKEEREKREGLPPMEGYVCSRAELLFCSPHPLVGRPSYLYFRSLLLIFTFFFSLL